MFSTFTKSALFIILIVLKIKYLLLIKKRMLSLQNNKYKYTEIVTRFSTKQHVFHKNVCFAFGSGVCQFYRNPPLKKGSY